MEKDNSEKKELVELVHGAWKRIEAFENPFYAYECNICGHHAPVKMTPYCPYCGAKMDLPVIDKTEAE